jgi:hypothetical protein
MMIVVYFLLRARDAAVLASTGARDVVEGLPATSGSSPGTLVTTQRVGLPLRLVRNAHARAIGIIVATTLAIAAGWTILQRVTETINPNKLLVNAQFVVHSISVGQIGSTFGVFLAPVPGAYVPTALESVWTINMANLLSWLLITGMIAAAIFTARSAAMASLARATLLLAVLGGPIFVILNFLSMSQYIPMPPRYGFTLLPAMIVCTADAVRARWVGVSILAIGLLSVAFVAYAMA